MNQSAYVRDIRPGNRRPGKREAVRVNGLSVSCQKKLKHKHRACFSLECACKCHKLDLASEVEIDT